MHAWHSFHVSWVMWANLTFLFKTSYVFLQQSFTFECMDIRPSQYTHIHTYTPILFPTQWQEVVQISAETEWERKSRRRGHNRSHGSGYFCIGAKRGDPKIQINADLSLEERLCRQRDCLWFPYKRTSIFKLFRKKKEKNNCGLSVYYGPGGGVDLHVMAPQ